MAYEQLINELTEEVFRIEPLKQRKKIIVLIQKLLDGISHENSERAASFRKKRAEIFLQDKKSITFSPVLYKEDVEKVIEYFFLVRKIAGKEVSCEKKDIVVKIIPERGSKKNWACEECGKIIRKNSRSVIDINYDTKEIQRRTHTLSFCSLDCVENFLNIIDEKISKVRKDLASISSFSIKKQTFFAFDEEVLYCGREEDNDDDPADQSLDQFS